MSVNATFTGMVERNLVFFSDMTQTLDEKGYDTLDPFRDNLYRAINFGGQTPAHNLTAALLVLRCTQYIEQRCNYRHWAKLLTRVANRYDADDAVTFARLLSMTGYFRFQAGQLDRAERAYRSAERIALRSEDSLAVVTAWYYLGIMYYQRDEIGLAKPLVERALGALKEVPHSEKSVELLGYLLNLSALIQMGFGDYEAAERDLLYASKTLSNSRSKYYYHLIHYNLAKLRIHQNRFADAETLLLQEIAYCQQHDLHTSHARTITRLTYLYIKQENWSKALETCMQVNIVDLQKRGNLGEIAMAKNNLGFIHLHLNHLEKAETYLAESIHAWKLLQRDLEIANSLASLAAVQYAQRAYAACRTSCAQARQYLGQLSQESVRAAEVEKEIADLLLLLDERSDTT